MPDGGGLVILALAVVAAAWVAIPLLRGAAATISADDGHEELDLRHRAAADALREVEADRRAGLLDDAAYLRERDEAEAQAVTTLDDLEASQVTHRDPSPPQRVPRSLVAAAAALAALVVIGVLLPEPFSLANAIEVDEALATAQAAEATRVARIEELLDDLGQDPRDVEALSELADAYLAGNAGEDLYRAATTLQLLIALSPEDDGAYRRIITAYIRAGDYANARAALTAFEAIDPDAADVAFFRGLIALDGDDDPRTAIDAFDRFLELAPGDGRASMVRALRGEAEAMLGD